MTPQLPITVIGAGPWSGAYLLKIEVTAALAVSFGRFAQGRPVCVAPGSYLYIGSARSNNDLAAPLLARVTRHLQRTPPRPPQRLWAEWQVFVAQHQAHTRTPPPKRLHWHIDFLLDKRSAHVVQIVLIPAAQPMERWLAESMEALDCTAPLAPGLGASDHRGHTHLMRWQGTDAAWAAMRQDLAALAAAFRNTA